LSFFDKNILVACPFYQFTNEVNTIYKLFEVSELFQALFLFVFMPARKAGRIF